MPSRKKAQGKARKATKAAQATQKKRMRSLDVLRRTRHNYSVCGLKMIHAASMDVMNQIITYVDS